MINVFTSDLPSRKRRKIQILEEHESDEYFAYSWGDGLSALLPDGVEKQTIPHLIESLNPKVFDIRIYRLLKNGVGIIFDRSQKIYSFGRGKRAGLGHGDEANVRKPKRIERLSDEKIVEVCGGHFGDSHTLFFERIADYVNSILNILQQKMCLNVFSSICRELSPALSCVVLET